MEETHLNIIKTMYDKPTAKVILNAEKLKAFLKDQEQDKYVHSCHIYSI